MASTGGVSVVSCHEMSRHMTYLHVMSCQVVLSLVVAASSACVYQHHHMISQHGMTR